MTKTLGAYVIQAFRGSRKTILQSGFFRSFVWRDVLSIRKARYLAVRDQAVIQWRRFQSFFADPARALNSDERILWERESLVALAARTGWWLLIVLIASLAVLACVFFAYSSRDEKPDSWMGLWLWFVAVWALSAPYFSLKSRLLTLINHTPSNSEELRHKHKEIRKLVFLWAGWLAAIMVVWIIIGTSSLISTLHTDNDHPYFILGSRSFMYLTLIGQISTVLLLCVNRIVLFSILLAVVFSVYFSTPSDIPSPILYIYYYGTVGLNLFIAWLLTHEQKRVQVESARAESERRRANRFIAAISHDLRQPLTSISLRVNSLLRNIDTGTKNLQANLTAIKEQTIAIETMVNGSLDMSRLEAGEMKVEVRGVQLSQLVEDIVASFRSEAADKSISLEVSCSPYLVRTDANLLHRILRNLIENAIRYTPTAGKVLLECRPDGDVMRISVVDNGVGIPREKFREIFEEYVQLSNPERDRRKGLGLGLAIVRLSVELLQKHEPKHNLEYDSEVGRGSRFSVLVPIIAELLPECDHGSNEDPDLSGLTVVVVDDDEGPRDALCQRLFQCGCYVVDAESTEELIAKIKSDGVPSGPHFILSDYRLREGKNGIETIEAIRQATNPKIPAAIWSAVTKLETLEKISAAGLPLIVKPNETKVLQLLRQRAREIHGNLIV
jgi:signal transduction histidine kinase